MGAGGDKREYEGRKEGKGDEEWGQTKEETDMSTLTESLGCRLLPRR